MTHRPCLHRSYFPIRKVSEKTQVYCNCVHRYMDLGHKCSHIGNLVARDHTFLMNN